MPIAHLAIGLRDIAMQLHHAEHFLDIGPALLFGGGRVAHGRNTAAIWRLSGKGIFAIMALAIFLAGVFDP